LDEMIALCHEMIGGVLRCVRGSLTTYLHGRAVHWTAKPTVRAFRDLVEEYGQIAIDEFSTAEALSRVVRSRGWWLGHGDERDGLRSAWLEWLLEHRVLPALEVPTYVVEFPSELGLSARPCSEDPRVSLRAELYFPNGWELAHLYENLTDPGPLRERLMERRQRRVAYGYPEVALDEGLLGSAELGMPPMAGFALGVDRLLMLVLGGGEIGQGLLFGREGFEEYR
jgi:lysyl-tRNA synthetase class II